MNYLLEVCLLAVALAASIPSAPQAMRKGISVELPPTSHAVPMPDADEADSLIVSVTNDGRVYFGVDQVSPASLSEKVKGRLSNRAEKQLYIKADVRTPYANVAKVLDAVRTAGVEAPIFLTAQRDASEPSTLVPPKGLETLMASPSASQSTVVQLLSSGQPTPMLKINNHPIPWTDLQSTLRQVVQSRTEQVVLVKADGRLPFSSVVNVIDMCRSTGAKVALARSGE